VIAREIIRRTVTIDRHRKLDLEVDLSYLTMILSKDLKERIKVKAFQLGFLPVNLI
jgi:hypothetical protein